MQELAQYCHFQRSLFGIYCPLIQFFLFSFPWSSKPAFCCRRKGHLIHNLPGQSSCCEEALAEVERKEPLSLFPLHWTSGWAAWTDPSVTQEQPQSCSLSQADTENVQTVVWIFTNKYIKRKMLYTEKVTNSLRTYQVINPSNDFYVMTTPSYRFLFNISLFWSKRLHCFLPRSDFASWNWLNWLTHFPLRMLSQAAHVASRKCSKDSVLLPCIQRNYNRLFIMPFTTL